MTLRLACSGPATRALLGIRLGVGLLAFAAPRVVLAPLASDDPAAVFITRLFAARELGYAAALAVGPSTSLGTTLRIGIATDLADAGAALLAARARHTSRAVATAVFFAGLSAGACGAIALREAH